MNNRSVFKLLLVAVFGIAVAGCDKSGSIPEKPAPKPPGTTPPMPKTGGDLTQRQRDVMNSAKQVQGVVDAGEEARRRQLDAAESK